MDFLKLKNSENSCLLTWCIYTLFFIRALLWEQNPRFWPNKIRTKLRTKSGMLNIKSQVFRLAILKIIRIKHQKRAWLSLILYCMKSSLLSLLMTTPYLVLLLTVLKISITKDLFFFLTFCCIILRFLVL